MNDVIFVDSLLDYRDYRMYSSEFLETGSAAGDGIQRALNAGFEDVTSCEAASKWYELSKKRFAGDDRVNVINMRSINFLVLFVSNKTRQVIFLDAHSSGPESFGHKECIEGVKEFQQDEIIKAELDVILSRNIRHVIIIDDVNGMDDGHATEYMEMMRKVHLKYRFSFWDENLSGDAKYYYKNKILVAVP